MKDPIADILRKLDIDMAQAVASGSAKGLGNYDEPVKQIRQQIGRELRSYIQEVEGQYRWAAGRNWIEPMLKEVCKLDES